MKDEGLVEVMDGVDFEGATSAVANSERVGTDLCLLGNVKPKILEFAEDDSEPLSEEQVHRIIRENGVEPPKIP